MSDASNISEQQRIDMRTREGKATAAAQIAAANGDTSIRASLADAGASPQEMAASLSPPSEVLLGDGRRITRENRRGFGNQGQKLAYPQRPGYHRHWFNDTPGRVMGSEESGFTKVNDPITGKPVSRIVGTQQNGDPLAAYLLEIPQEWYDDDMRELEKINAEKEATIRGGAEAKDAKDAGQFYAGAQGRAPSIRQSTSRR